MPDDHASVPVLLSPALAKALDDAARREGRTRSEIVEEALQKHLVKDHDGVVVGKGRLDRLLKFAGAGAELSTFKSAEEVDATIRHLRGDD